MMIRVDANTFPKDEKYDLLVKVAKHLMESDGDNYSCLSSRTFQNEAYNFIRWLSQEDVDSIVGQFGFEEE